MWLFNGLIKFIKLTPISIPSREPQVALPLQRWVEPASLPKRLPRPPMGLAQGRQEEVQAVAPSPTSADGFRGGLHGLSTPAKHQGCCEDTAPHESGLTQQPLLGTSALCGEGQESSLASPTRCTDNCTCSPLGPSHPGSMCTLCSWDYGNHMGHVGNPFPPQGCVLVLDC